MTLARPERRNAINPELAQDFTAAFEALAAREVRVVTLEAEGPAFCAGADLSDLEAGGRAMDSVVHVLLSQPVHVTAVVRGAARGAGLAILAACPRVVASPSASFGMPELSRGFFPSEVIASQVGLVGARRAFGMAFSAAPITAHEAHRVGLIDDVVPDDAIQEWASVACEALTAAPSEGLVAGVRAWQSTLRASRGKSTLDDPRSFA